MRNELVSKPLIAPESKLTTLPATRLLSILGVSDRLFRRSITERDSKKQKQLVLKMKACARSIELMESVEVPKEIGVQAFRLKHALLVNVEEIKKVQKKRRGRFWDFEHDDLEMIYRVAKAGYKKLIKVHHPDHGGDSLQFRLVTEAWKIFNRRFSKRWLEFGFEIP